MCSDPSDLLSHLNPAYAHIATRQDGMGNSNKLVYTSTYKEVPVHVDLQLARKPQVAAHTPPRSPKQADPQLAMKLRVAAHTPLQRPVQADLQLARKPRVAAYTPPRDPVHTDLQLARHADTRNSDQ